MKATSRLTLSATRVLVLMLLTLATAGRAALAAPAGGERCVAAVETACLLNDGFSVRVFAGGDGGSGELRLLDIEGVGLDTARFSWAPADRPDRVDLTVRVVDGRAVNGYYWLLAETDAAGGAPSDIEIAVTDVGGGRTRRFVLEQGSRGLRELRAFSGEAQTVAVTLDAARAVRKPIGAGGGSIVVVDAQGTRFQVAFPAKALNLTTDITVTPVLAIAGLPLSGGLRGAVRIEPEGVIPARTVLLTITPAPAVPAAQQLTFAFRGLAGEFFLTPPQLSSTALVLPVHRLGGYGLGAGTAGDLTAQLARLPTREEDRLNQRLAGLLLPPRRAGTKALPPTVAQLLIQEFNARINARLATVRKGGVAKFYGRLKNWTLSARDTGLARKESAESGREADTVAILEARVRAAILEGIRLDFQRNADVCIGLKDRKAMVKAFSAFAELAREGALRSGDATKLKRCVRFELHWDTEIQAEPAIGIMKDFATVEVPLTYSQGAITGSKIVTQTPTFTAPPCSTALLATSPVTLRVDRVDDPNLNFWDDGELTNSLALTLYYSVLPGSAVSRWRISCPDTAPLDTNTAWVFMYIVLHFPELDLADSFRVVLQPRPGDGRIYGEKFYLRTEQQITEDTALILRHEPQ